jgi:hypothetical protein
MTGSGMWPNQGPQDLANELAAARGRFAVAMANPKDTIELNEAKAELTRLEQEVGAISDKRAYGAGCDADRRGIRDLHGHGETGAQDVLYSGTYRYLNQKTTEAHYDEAKVTGQRANPSWAADTLPAHDHSQDRRR